MSFFEELKRRNVFRVGIAYAISAWVLLQVVDLVLENILAPVWVMQTFMLALAIGLPLALIVAWAFEMTPEGVKLEKDVVRDQSITHKTGQKLNRNISIVLGVAVVFLLVDRFQGSGSNSPEPVQAVGSSNSEKLNLTPAPETREKSIAVLPFVDMSPEADQAYFADGISEEILNVLVKTRSLKVAGRTSSFQFRGRNGDLKTIGEQLGVNHILEGSIRKANNRVRITAQLISASDGFHLWSESYDRDLTDIFAIQDEIARAITQALAIELDLTENGQELVKVTTGNMDAYDRFLEARALIAQRSNFPRAIKLLDEATQLDPNFAAGWAANAQAHALYIYYFSSNPDEDKKLAETMANKALEIDPDLSMAYSVLGDIYRDRYEWLRAKESYLRALSLNPDEIEANEQYAQMLWRASYFDEALKYSARAAELDPLSTLNQTVNAGLRYVSGDRAGGWADMDRLLAMDTDQLERPFAVRHATSMALSDGKLERAIEMMKIVAASRPVQAGELKFKQYFEELIPLLKSREQTLAFLSANQGDMFSPGVKNFWELSVFCAAYYGDYELAWVITEAGTSHESRNGTLDMHWLNYPFLSPLHNAEPYKRLIKKIGVYDFWRENGFPRYCRPIGEDDFACN